MATCPAPRPLFIIENALQMLTHKSVSRRRLVHVLATPSTSSIQPPMDLSDQTRAIPKLSGDGPFPQQTQFEVLGSPFSLLSVSLPSSSTLYTRRGTLVGVNGKAENASSTLSILEPFRRAPFGIPFLYQKIFSTTPLTCLISTNSLNSSFAIIKLDGKADWMVIPRKALLAWVGHSLVVKPIIHRNLSLAHWGSSKLIGRGLVALVGRGQVFQIVLQPGEEYMVHSSNLLAYSLNTVQVPQLYRLPHKALRLQVPDLGLSSLISNFEPFRKLFQSDTYKRLSKAVFIVRQWIQQTIWGDRQLLRFHGPSTILVQSRMKRAREIFTKEDIGDDPFVEPGAFPEKNMAPRDTGSKGLPTKEAVHPPRYLGTKVAMVEGSGRVTLADSDLKEFVRA